MALTRTTHDEVRAVLGVSVEEIENSTLDLKVFTDQLEIELSDIDSTLPAQLDTITGVIESARTPEQKKLFAVANMFSAYAYARILLTSLALFSPKTITDGRAQTERVTDPFADTRDGVQAGYVAMRQRVQAALAIVEPAYTAPARLTQVFTAAVGLASDPVTA